MSSPGFLLRIADCQLPIGAFTEEVSLLLGLLTCFVLASYLNDSDERNWHLAIGNPDQSAIK